MRTRVLFALAIWSAVPLAAQLVPPNDAGVTMGHVHLYVKSVEAQTRFWTTMMGGKAVANEKLAMIQFPGVFIILREMDTERPSGRLYRGPLRFCREGSARGDRQMESQRL